MLIFPQFLAFYEYFKAYKKRWISEVQLEETLVVIRVFLAKTNGIWTLNMGMIQSQQPQPLISSKRLKQFPKSGHKYLVEL